MSLTNTESFLREELESRKETGNLRALPSPLIGVDFCSNDYLGFAHYPPTELTNLVQGKSGSSSSRLIAGNLQELIDTETYLSKAHQSEAALLFNSGYAANTGLLSAIGDKHSLFIYDEYCHASIIDGMRLSFAKRVKFKHNDIDSLRAALITSKAERRFIVIESVYSMDGDAVDVESIMTMAREFDAELIVDEAHAIGVSGPENKGLFHGKNVFAKVLTFGKALGLHGAAVLGSQTLIDFLVNFSRPFIYTTAMPPDQAKKIMQAYEAVKNTDRTIQLHSRIVKYKQLVTELGLQKCMSLNEGPIQVLMLPGNQAAKEFASTLSKSGLDVKAILSPTVPEGKERLRISLHAFNEDSEIEFLLKKIHELKS
ncbi:MAG TPA: 8-amino-7-oxononanoate synthase [Bacteroidia bacterium]